MTCPSWHPQTFLAYGMNGGELPVDHGAPVRMKSPGSSVTRGKYISHITVTDSMKHIGDGPGSPAPAAGYSWYAGI